MDDAPDSTPHAQGKKGAGGEHSLRMMPIWLAACGAAWAVFYLVTHDYQARVPYAEEAHLGIHLALGHGFLSPMDLSASAPPSAWSAPVYPWVISLAYRLFGIETPRAVALLMIVNACCFGAFVAGIFALGRLLFRARGPGLLAAITVAFHPMYLFFAGDFWDGMLALALFTWMAVFAMSRDDAKEPWMRSPAASSVVLGTAMGLLALTNPAYSATYPVLLAMASRRRFRPRQWFHVSCAVLVFAAVLAPWTLRNIQVFGRLFYVRTALGLNLWLGSEPLTRGWLDDPRSHALQPYVNLDERALLFTLGEPGYDDLCRQRFKQNYLADPTGYWTLAARKSGYLALGNPLRPTPYSLLPNIQWHGLFIDGLILNGLLSVLGISGILAARRRGLDMWPAMLLPCLAIPYVLAGVQDLYSLPFRALLILYAAFAAWELVARIKLPRRGSPSEKDGTGDVWRPMRQLQVRP